MIIIRDNSVFFNQFYYNTFDGFIPLIDFSHLALGIFGSLEHCNLSSEMFTYSAQCTEQQADSFSDKTGAATEGERR